MILKLYKFKNCQIVGTLTPHGGQLHSSKRAKSCIIVQQSHKDMNTMRTKNCCLYVMKMFCVKLCFRGEVFMSSLNFDGNFLSYNFCISSHKLYYNFTWAVVAASH